METNTTNKQIVKNTIFLYFRMGVTIVVNLYTTRLLWKILGIEDYGIFNVVGGLVLMFAFINNSMVSTSQRFLSYELGSGNKARLQNTFSISLIVHFTLAICIIIFAETLGLWFLNTKMTIPLGREGSANWVYQCSVFSFVLTVISVPYNACIVAHERMKVYGYFGIIDVVLKLIVVISLCLFLKDRLIVYSILLVLVAVIMRIIYGLYCIRNFQECRLTRIKDRRLLREMFAFAGWSFIGNMGFTFRNQGMNILINIFFNVTVNAAKGIATTVGSGVSCFASYFTMAINPQITKRYAIGAIDSMIQLVCVGCKCSLLMMSIIVIPLYISSKDVLHLWLGDVAPYTDGFVKLTLLLSLIECTVGPITTSLQATGRIRRFQVWMSIIMGSSVAMAWCALKSGADPYTTLYVTIVCSIVAFIVRLILLHGLINFSYRNFISIVFIRTIPCIIVGFIINSMTYKVFPATVFGLISYGLVTCFSYILICYLIGLNRAEKEFVAIKIKQIIRFSKGDHSK